MRFAVLIENKIVPVIVRREPSNLALLSSFRCEKNTYQGDPDMFNGLAFDKKKKIYTAASIIVKPVTKIVVVDPPPPPTEEKEFRKMNFQSRWHYLYPGTETFGEGHYVKDRGIWTAQHGSEHLKIAVEMRCKCDGLYIQERADKEFPGFAVHEDLEYYEIDSPPYGLLTFLKSFKDLHKKTLQEYRSRVIPCTTKSFPNEDLPCIVVADYLGHCDLSISLERLVNQYGDKC